MEFFNLFRRHTKNRQDQKQDLSSADNQSDFSIDFNLQNNPMLEDGLSYGDILMLNWLNGQQINKKIPGYFVERFQINPLAAKQKYKNKGLLISGDTTSRLQVLKVPQLKQILKENNQKVSGRKIELISRIQQNINKSHYVNSLPKTFGLSTEALSLLKQYKLLIWANDNDHILSPMAYIPFINSNKTEPEIAIDLLENHISDLIAKNEPFITYQFSATETEIATFYKSLDNEDNYVKHSVYSILVDYFCVSEIKNDGYTEPFDSNTQYIQTYVINNLQDKTISEAIVNLIVVSFIHRYNDLLVAFFRDHPELGTEAIIGALTLQPSEYHRNRLAVLREIRKSN